MTTLARLLVFVGLSASILAAGCKTYTNPTTGRKQYDALTRDQEVALGASEGPKMTAEMGGEVQNPALRAYVNEVGQKLKDHTEVDGPQRPWVFTLLDSDVINAFALPGERVFISRGLADKMTSEAQLAGVLGHEIGHVMAKHIGERIAKAQAAQVGAVGAAVLSSIFIKDSAAAGAVASGAGAGAQLWVLSFSREQETESDILGMRYMTKAGYNPRGQLEVMQILQQASGGKGGVEWLQTHPLPQTRITDVQRLLETEYAYTQSGPQAGNYQAYADRFRERYLALRAAEPPKPQPQKRRTMSDIILGDPTTWCATCREGAQHAQVHAGEAK